MDGHMSLLEYMGRSYKNDLRTFRREVGWTIPYLPGDELTRLCRRLGIDHVYFISLTYPESLLLAAVCTYDFANFDAYREEIKVKQHLGAIGGLQGLRLPQKMFAGLKWGPEHLQILRDGIATLLPRWAAEYDQRFGRPGAGEINVEIMLYDADVYEIPQGVEPAFVDAVKAGIEGAARSLGIQRNPDRPIERHVPGYRDA